jgi:hypothetical protein
MIEGLLPQIELAAVVRKSHAGIVPTHLQPIGGGLIVEIGKASCKPPSHCGAPLRKNPQALFCSYAGVCKAHFRLWSNDARRSQSAREAVRIRATVASTRVAGLDLLGSGSMIATVHSMAAGSSLR